MKTGLFCSKILCNPFTHNIGLGYQFETSDSESDTEDDTITNTNIEEWGNGGNGKVTEPDVETVDLPGYVEPQGFAYDS